VILSSSRGLFLFFVLLIFTSVLVLGPFWGSTSLDYGQVFQNWDPANGHPDAEVFFRVRLPRHLLAALAGAVLSLSGVVFQAVLRNPLACPFTLGVAGGSSFGAVVAILLGWTFGFHGFSLVTLFSFLGALFSLLLVYTLAGALRTRSVITLLLAGVAVNYFFNALVLLVYYVADFTQAYAMIHWMIGSLDLVDMGTVGHLSLGFFAGFLVLWSMAPSLNLLSAGEEWAKTKGVSTGWVMGISVMVASLLTSAIVALTGPIAFVGLIVPHVFRIWLGNDHRYLIPVSALGGAAFLMVCDGAARSMFGPTEIPVGVLTALGGVPVLLWLLFRQGDEA
jgi:iron complex transport system permease protein